MSIESRGGRGEAQEQKQMGQATEGSHVRKREAKKRRRDAHK
jgi:hypothetical protein